MDAVPPSLPTGPTATPRGRTTRPALHPGSRPASVSAPVGSAPATGHLALLLLAVALVAAASGCATRSSQGPVPAPATNATAATTATATTWPRYTLRATRTVQLTPPPGRPFEASALLFLPDGSLITVGNTHGPTPYRIDLPPAGPDATLVALTNWFPSNAVARAIGTVGLALDCEGLALDERGRLYVCEERQRWILRGDTNGVVERLPIDWSPARQHFSSVDANASFEGIAIGNGHLYVANERSSPVILDLDLRSLQLRRDFVIQPSRSSLLGLHYSDLCWFEGRLWILCRQHQVVLQVDPDSRRVLAEFDYGELEDRLGYVTGLPLGIMEGLAVDAHHLWLVTDNNGHDRRSARGDRRPTLLQCPRPDRP